MVVIDKNRKFVGIYDSKWANGKKGCFISDNIFQLSYIHLGLKQHNFTVHVSMVNNKYNIAVKDGVFTTNIEVESQQEMKAVVKAIDAKRVVIDKNKTNTPIVSSATVSAASVPVKEIVKPTPEMVEAKVLYKDVIKKESLEINKETEGTENVVDNNNDDIKKSSITIPVSPITAVEPIETTIDTDESKGVNKSKKETDSYYFDEDDDLENIEIFFDDCADKMNGQKKEPNTSESKDAESENIKKAEEKLKPDFIPTPIVLKQPENESWMPSFLKNKTSKESIKNKPVTSAESHNNNSEKEQNEGIQKQKSPAADNKKNIIPVPVVIPNIKISSTCLEDNAEVPKTAGSEEKIMGNISVVAIPSGTEHMVDKEEEADNVGIGLEEPEANLTEKYRYKFYLDANHYISFNDEKGAIHPHTWEIAIEIKNKEKGKMVKFSELEAIVKEVLAPYQMNCLNDIPPFDKVNPVTESIGHYFKEQIQIRISSGGWDITELAISESANRTYVI